MNDTPLKRTPTEAVARAAGATLVNDAGWLRAVAFPGPPGELWLSDETGRGTLLIQGQAGSQALGALGLASPVAIGAGEENSDVFVYRLRPDQLLVLTRPGAETAALAALVAAVEQTGDLITVTDVTHSRANLRLSGQKAATLLGRLCALDLDAAAFPDRTARQTSVAKTTQLIIRDDLPDGQPSYYLSGARSLGAYLWSTLLAAGEEMGLRPTGAAKD